VKTKTKSKPRSQDSKLYSEYCHLYEPIFHRMFEPRIRAAVESLRIKPGAKVLEVGVGAGVSLSAYPPHAEVIGIDLSADMLEHAQRKVESHGWTHVRLRQMDALNMDFPDESFDYVTAFHVISVVPDPERLVREIARVTRPGGKVLIINHFRSEKKWLGPLVALLDPVTRRLGWRTTLRFADVVGHSPLQVEHRFKIPRRSLFTVVIARKPGIAQGV